MNYKMIGRLISLILFAEALFMLPAMLLCIMDGDYRVMRSFIYTIIIILAVVAAIYPWCRKAPKRFYAREGLVCVALAWIVMSLAGCLPFWFSREIPSFIDALFEIVSGFTTTGASILSDVEALSRGLIYWRSFSHWVGGMGVLVFVLAIIPVSGRNDGFALHLLRAESTGPSVGKLVPRMRQTALILYALYVSLTVINMIFLLIGKMPVFDTICTAFGTAGTGGFGIKNDSMAGYSPYLQNVTTVFMLLFGVNFSLYYLLLLRQFSSVFKDQELRVYCGITLSSIALIFFNIQNMFDSVSEGVRHAAFQVASIITTTGYMSTDFDQWPAFSKAILLTLMITGACAGSTAGGLKCIRVLLLCKVLYRNIRKVLHPNKVQVVKVNRNVVQEKTLENTNAYLAAYVIIIIFSFIIISLDGFSITTNISAVLSCFNNIGPGLEAVGPTCNFGSYSILSKIVLILNMLAGRLEIFPILVLFSRGTWSKNRAF